MSNQASSKRSSQKPSAKQPRSNVVYLSSQSAPRPRSRLPSIKKGSEAGIKIIKTPAQPGRAGMAVAGVPKSYRGYVKQIVLPDKDDLVRTLPARGAQAACTRAFKQTFAIGAADLVDGKLMVSVPASHTGLVQYTSDSRASQYPDAYDLDFKLRYKSRADGSCSGESVDGDLIIPGELITHDGKQIRPVVVTVAQASTYTLHMEAGYAHLVSIYCYNGGTGVWRTATDAYFTASHGTFNFQMAATDTRLYIKAMQNVNGEAVNCTFTITPASDANEKMIFKSSVNVVLFNRGENFLQNQTVSHIRLSGMSALLSNTSASLEKQGNIFCGVVPSSEGVPAQDDWAKLPAYNYHSGLAQDGGYVWWSPNSENMMEILPVAEAREALHSAENIFFSLSGLDIDASFLLTVVWVVDFYSEKQIFEKSIPPPISQNYLELVRYLKVCPHASCNPEHESNFKDILKRGFDTAKGIYDHYQENAALYNGLAALLASLV